jgi:pheromone shutdown-related protein TraB
METIREITLGERTITLVGTAHVSRSSVEEVERVIRERMPDRLCVEIDEGRYRSIKERRSWADLNIYQVIRQGKGFLLLGNLVLSSFQKRMGVELGVRPGEEMMSALAVAEELGIPSSLCDREIQTTLRRAWMKTGFWGKNKMLAALLGSVFSSEKLTPDEIEKLKQQSALENMLEELSEYLPSAKEVLIDERDRFLASKIFESEGDRIVAVVGAGHVPGIVRWLESLQEGNAESDLSDISTVPAKKPISKVLPWIIPVAILGLFVFGFFRSGWELTRDMLLLWILVNGSLASIGALAALGHPLTILGSFVAAPITSLNPTIGVGFVSGIMEAYFRKPRVLDVENLQEDIATVKGFFRNRITRTLLVFFFTTVGSAIGTFVGIPFLTSLLAGSP